VADAIPFITTQPQSIRGIIGQPAQFSVVAGVYDGTAPLYQWQVSTDKGVTYSDIVGATNNSYSITSVSASEHSNRYRVRVSAAGVPQFGGSSSLTSAAAVLHNPDLPDGSSAALAAPSAMFIKNNFPDSVDGVYWINLPSSGPTPIYCIMNSAVSGGGWMMAMKATRANTFSYDSAYWTQKNTLNPSATNRADGDAKFAVMNEYAANDALALWPDLGAGGDIAGIYSSWVWLEAGVLGNKALTTFFATQAQMGRNRIRGTQWAGKFSSQEGYQFYGFNYSSNGSVKVRWGFGWNNEYDQDSNDVSGGIGMSVTGWSAGDWIGCCENTAGFNRSARVEIYVR
jgi:hypothetical protein